MSGADGDNAYTACHLHIFLSDDDIRHNYAERVSADARGSFAHDTWVLSHARTARCRSSAANCRFLVGLGFSSSMLDRKPSWKLRKGEFHVTGTVGAFNRHERLSC